MVGIILVYVLVFALILLFAVLPIRLSILRANGEKFRVNNKTAWLELDNQYQHHQIQAGGVNWHYIDTGNPDGEAVLFVHGLPENYYSWNNVLPLIDSEYRLIAIDMKGYGRSIPSDDNYEWHHVAGQTLDFMDALGIEQFHIVGHDWGAIISSVLVGDYPERILSFARMECDLFSPADRDTKYKEKPQWLLFKNEWISKQILSDYKLFINLVFNEKRMSTDLPDIERTYYMYEFSRPGVANAVAKYFLDKNRDLEALFDKIAYNDFSFPVLQVQADSDPAQPLELFSKIPEVCKNVELAIIRDSGHFTGIDRPEQVAQAINSLLKSAKQ
ncbi:MAG: alpha/beta hydrolase [Eubacteriaceae bacterium]|jgi:pimeloyl-ACP methyl ester carboxylesterase|nr:alpha/beta hydrolase [Eubacteriaceae bacterium]